MSNGTHQPARPVSLFTIVFLFALFAAFLLVIRYFYTPATIAPQNLAAENMGKDLEWRADAESRRKTLAEQSEQQAKQLNSYGWADQDAKRVQLPIHRAMELTAKQYGTAKSADSNPPSR